MRRAALHQVVGVDGHYGRHYSFLKAVLALWHVAIDPAVRATFKIDLDQVFPQDVPCAPRPGARCSSTCARPLWGAAARDAGGTKLELGMLAGALVNERDIAQGLFTPDVPIPDRLPSLGRARLLQRPAAVHLDACRDDGALRRHLPSMASTRRSSASTSPAAPTASAWMRCAAYRPFTPSWVGRAEDQAYLLSALGRPGTRLAYAHAAGLIMRHDKEAFAGQAMAAAHISKLIGDDVRILVFSAYVDALVGDGSDGEPPTTCSTPSPAASSRDIPQTLVLLRLALRTLRLFGSGQTDDAREYAVEGTRRVARRSTPTATRVVARRLRGNVRPGRPTTMRWTRSRRTRRARARVAASRSSMPVGSCRTAA